MTKKLSLLILGAILVVVTLVMGEEGPVAQIAGVDGVDVARFQQSGSGGFLAPDSPADAAEATVTEYIEPPTYEEPPAYEPPAYEPLEELEEFPLNQSRIEFLSVDRDLAGR